MNLDGTLGDLARLRSGSEPIVSLYLDVRWRDEQQRERVRLFVHDGARTILHHYADDAPGREGLARTLDKVQAFVAGLAAQAYEADRNGLALFACASLGLWRPLLFGRPVENELSADGIPHLAKLARLLEEVVPAIVVVPTKEGADVYEVRLGDLDFEGSVRGPPAPRTESERLNAGTGRPGRHYEREKKNERREENFAHRNRRTAAEEVTALFERTAQARLVLVGTAETVAAFERELPPRVVESVVARVPRPREWGSADGIRRDGVKALAERVLCREREEERREVDEVVGEALRGAVAVVGPEDVVLALNEGRVQTLVLEDDFARAGFRCDNCDALGAREATDACPFCGGELRSVPNLGEALVARTLAEGGRVEVVPHGNKLHSYRGVAAKLRQTAPTGLRGASQPWPTAPGASQP
jgi:hypothetical protein